MVFNSTLEFGQEEGYYVIQLYKQSFSLLSVVEVMFMNTKRSSFYRSLSLDVLLDYLAFSLNAGSTKESDIGWVQNCSKPFWLLATLFILFFLLF